MNQTCDSIQRSLKLLALLSLHISASHTRFVRCCIRLCTSQILSLPVDSTAQHPTDENWPFHPVSVVMSEIHDYTIEPHYNTTSEHLAVKMML